MKMYRNPAAARIHDIARSGERLFIATDVGLLTYDGYYWERANIRGLDRRPTADVYAVEDELWLVGDDKIVTKANALSQITLMHVKWLPELTDDVYYEFVRNGALSAVTSPSSPTGNSCEPMRRPTHSVRLKVLIFPLPGPMVRR